VPLPNGRANGACGRRFDCIGAVILSTCNHSCTLSAGAPTKASKLAAAFSAVALVWAAVLAALALFPVAVEARPRGCAGANLRPTATNARAIDAATLCLIDRIRAGHHLRPLHHNHELGGVASSQVSTMVRRDYFADDRPSGQTPMSLIVVTRYPAHTDDIAVGENIAWGTGTYATPAHIVGEWMASPPHRAIILTSEYRDAGVAVTPALPSVLAVGSRGATYAVEFGVRRY
jgi:hypothetical protein